MRRMLLVASFLSVLLGLLGVPVSADADVRTMKDGADHSLPSQMDILRIKIDNRADRVVLRLTFRDLKPGRRAQTKIFIGTRPRSDEGFLAYSGSRPGAPPITQLWVPTDQEFGGTPTSCPGIRGRWQFDRNRIRIVVPQACLASSARRYRFKATAGFYGMRGDWTEFISVRRG